MNYDYMTEDEELMSMGEETIVPDIKPDMVNRPPHYTQGSIECIDAMEASRGKEALATYCEMTAFKYLWRTGHKWDDVEDLKKAVWYIEKAISVRG